MNKDSITSSLKEIIDRNGIPGLSAACVFEDDRAETFAIGWASVEDEERMTPQHRMLAASVGKTFTSATTMALVHQGKVNLDSPIAEWLDDGPWFRELANNMTITPRMLLNHTSGLADHRESPRFAASLKAELLKELPDYDLYFSPAKLVSFILGEPARFKAGTAYAYSETGYILAGMVIEKASDANYYDLVNKYFIDRFDLDSIEPANNRDIENLAQGYFGPNDVGLPEYSLANGRLSFNPGSEWTGGGFVGTPVDLARWAKVLFQGKALSGAYLDDLLTIPVASENETEHYGLGCYIWQTDLGEVYGHTGDQIGYRAIMAYYPKFKAALSVQINSAVPPREVLLELRDTFSAGCFELT